MAFVYLIEDQGSDNYFKIGATRGKLEKRLKTLQTGNGNEIRMHSFYETEFPFQLEKMLHLKFGNARKKGEWFEMNCDDIIHFRDKCKECEDILLSLKDNPYMEKIFKKN